MVLAALVIAEPTVEWHVANIMDKLGVHARAQIAVWVTRNLAALWHHGAQKAAGNCVLALEVQNTVGSLVGLRREFE
jgi:hypothetical protein